jgi:hemolysin III
MVEAELGAVQLGLAQQADEVKDERRSNPPSLSWNDADELKAFVQWYTPPRRQCSKRELLADRLVHIVGLVVGCATAVVLAKVGYNGAPGRAFAGLVYSAGFIIMFGCSFYLHLQAWDWERFDRNLFYDHSGISAMIIGCYAPIMMQAKTWWCLALVATLGVGGCVLEAIQLRRGIVPMISWDPHHAIRFLCMGWCVLIVVPYVYAALSSSAMLAVFVGGVLYSVGVLFLVSNFEFHLVVWHLFVLAASCAFFYATFDIVVTNEALW